ncbi:MAG: molybdopterin converting factor subunit 1 [Caldilineae bacterium]|nr:MAG: molybdopterin converting factor subunit 1 [Caldilineae bacterium]
MKVKIVLFAGLRQAAGFKQRDLALPEGATVGDLLAQLADEGAGWLQRTFYIAVNQEYAGRDAVLHDGDEVAFLPPVSGGMERGSGG